MKIQEINEKSYDEFIKDKDFLKFLKSCGETKKTFEFIIDGDDYDFSTLKSIHTYKLEKNIQVDVYLFRMKNGRIAIYNNRITNKMLKIVLIETGEEVPSKEILESF